MSPGPVRRATRWLWLLAALLPAVYLATCLKYRIRTSGQISQADAQRLMRGIRGALSAAKPDQARPKSDKHGVAWITLYHGGEPIFRHEIPAGVGLDQGIASAAQAIQNDRTVAQLPLEQLRKVRIKLDLVTGEGPIFDGIPLVFAKSIVPGLDGVGLDVQGRRAYLLPDDMFRSGLMAGYRPFFFMHEFKTGIDLQRVVNRLADGLGLSRDQWRAQSKSFFRFRVQSFVEAPGGTGH